MIRAAGPADAGALGRALAAAFGGDPFWGWLVGHPATRTARLERFFAVEIPLALARGDVMAADDLTGGALVFRPDRWRMPPAVVARNGPRLVRAFGHRTPVALGTLAKVEARHLREPHYYVAYVGVAPAGQGRGLGTRLLEPTLARCDREGVPAFLEASSPRNAALYERLGFEHLEEVRFLGSPPLRLMRRAPA